MSTSIRRSLFIGLSAIAVLPGVTRAQGETGLALEVNRYYGEHERTLVEGAVEIPYPLLVFSPNGQGLRANAKVEVMIEKANGEEVYHTEREIQPMAVNAEMAASNRVTTIETFAIYAPSGEYVARARVSDLTTDKSFEMSTPLTVPSERPFFSDVLLSNRVQKDVQLQEGSYLPYLIGSTMFNPNPLDVFYKDAPLLYFYYEIDPEGAAEASGAIELEMAIQRPGGEIVKDLGPRSIKVNEGRSFDLGAFNIGGLHAGRYALVVRCSTCAGEVRKETVFEVRQPLEQLVFTEPTPAGEAVPSNAEPVKYYADLSPTQVDSVIKVMDIWFTTEQRDLLGTLNANGKVQFLNRFWNGLDADPSLGDPSTEVNEPKATFEQRIAYANQFFSSLQRPGYETDRGRVYLLFGEPTEKIDRPVEATVGPYEIWNYSNAGHTFAFGDFSKDGTYRLIYSTNARYPGDPTIQNLVDTDTSTSLPTFLRTSRGYETIILDIRQYRTRTTAQF